MVDPESSSQTLLVLRLLWGASIVTQAVPAVATIVMLGDATVPPDGPSQRVLVFGVAASLAVLTPIGYFVRNQLYKANWRGDTITPRGYFTGNLVLLGLMESVSVAALVVAWVGGRALPAIYITGAAVLVQLINFPTGRPMQPTPPVFSERDRP